MTDPFARFRNAVLSALEDALEKLGYGKTYIEKLLEIPEKPFGDLAFPCFVLGKQAKKAPAVIADEISKIIPAGGYIEKIEAKGPYVNFFLNVKKVAEETLSIILSKKDMYGTIEPKKGRIIVEHTSANPTGPLHVGRARNPIIGDTLVRILCAAGYNVEAQFYLDDVGKQVAILAWGIKNISDVPAPERDKEDHKHVVYYQMANKRMEEEQKVAEQIDSIVNKCEKGDPETMKMIEEAYAPVLGGMIESLERINVRIDSFVKESRFIKDGSVEDVIKKLSKSKCCGVEGGAKYLELSEFGIKGKDTRFFFTRADGTSLYATRDIAYHLWKFKQAEHLINVLGEDHKLEAKQIAAALEILGVTRKPEVIFYSFVSLPEGRMSTRKGRVVYLDDLIDDAVERAYRVVSEKRPELPEEQRKRIAEVVGTGALRYNIIRMQPEKPMVFKWEEALNFEGNSAPFIQYSHARACSILKKSGEPPRIPEIPAFTDSEIHLIKIIARFPSVIQQAAESRSPHIIAGYAYELAERFNQFYRDCPVLSAEPGIRSFRLALVGCTGHVLKNALNLLGIEAPEEM